MIKSMTGFGRFELEDEKRKIAVEMKSVNHRYLELSIKLPKKLGFFENAIRTFLKQYISRGKVDVFITYEDFTGETETIKYNADVAAAYYTNILKMCKDLQLENDIRASSLAKFPDVFTIEEQPVDEEELWGFMETVLKGAAEKFTQSRRTEGEHLKQDIIEKLNGMLEMVDVIEERSPQIIEEYRSRISEKVKELIGNTQLDEARIATEVTLFADKVCIDEEIVRLKAHINAMKATLEEGANIGRKLDFIAQEMNREANTTLSKSNDLSISNVSIDLKTEIEKVREQIQNIE